MAEEIAPTPQIAGEISSYGEDEGYSVENASDQSSVYILRPELATLIIRSKTEQSTAT